MTCLPASCVVSTPVEGTSSSSCPTLRGTRRTFFILLHAFAKCTASGVLDRINSCGETSIKQDPLLRHVSISGFKGSLSEIQTSDRARRSQPATTPSNMPQAQPELKKVGRIHLHGLITRKGADLTPLVPRQKALRPTERQS